jgi:phospholipid transport system substrate-binding protein
MRAFSRNSDRRSSLAPRLPVRRWFAIALVACAAPLALAAAPGAEAPDLMVKRAVEEVTSAINADPGMQAGDRRKVGALVEQKVVPHFNIEQMTQSASGRHWSAATPAQRADLVREFKGLLINTYAGALSSYRHDTVIEYRPFRFHPGDTDAVVRSMVRSAGSPEPIQLDYYVELVDGVWKVSDLNVLGARLVEAYKGQFNSAIGATGIDGLIKTLAAKNRGFAARDKS